MDWLFLLGRIVFGGFFLFNGVNHFALLGAMAQYAGSKRVPAPKAAVAVTGVLLLLGGLGVLLGVYPRVAASLLIVFLLPTSVIMHDFWTEQDAQARQLQMTQFLKNLALAGASLILLTVDAWPLSLLA